MVGYEYHNMIVAVHIDGPSNINSLMKEREMKMRMRNNRKESSVDVDLFLVFGFISNRL